MSDNWVDEFFYKLSVLTAGSLISDFTLRAALSFFYGSGVSSALPKEWRTSLLQGEYLPNPKALHVHMTLCSFP